MNQRTPLGTLKHEKRVLLFTNCISCGLQKNIFFKKKGITQAHVLLIGITANLRGPAKDSISWQDRRKFRVYLVMCVPALKNSVLRIYIVILGVSFSTNFVMLHPNLPRT